MEIWIALISGFMVLLLVFLRTGLFDEILKMIEDFHFYHFTEEGREERL